MLQDTELLWAVNVLDSEERSDEEPLPIDECFLAGCIMTIGSLASLGILQSAI